MTLEQQLLVLLLQQHQEILQQQHVQVQALILADPPGQGPLVDHPSGCEIQALELCCQGVAGPLQGRGVQAFLAALQLVPVLRLLHRLVHILKDFPALVPCPAELLVLGGATLRVLEDALQQQRVLGEPLHLTR